MEESLYLISIVIIFVLILSCIIHCIYRIFKCICSCCKSKENRNYESVNFIAVQKHEEICQLPKVFGKNAKLYTVTGNLDRGLRHVYARHEGDFATSLRSNESDIAKSLQKNLTTSKFIGQEADSRGNRYIWKSNDRFGTSKQLVTILAPQGNSNFELITAYKR